MDAIRKAITNAILGGKRGGPWEGGIRAYHSSPHDFDKVDFSKLRTGEGANVYGAGHYLAENPAVSGQGGQYWSQFLHRVPRQERRAAEVLYQQGFDRDKAVAELRRRAVDPLYLQTPESRARWQEQIDLLASDKPVGPRTYEMNLRAKPEELLDWDKPLREQPQHLDTAYRLLPHMREAPGATGASFYDVLSNKLRGADFAKEGQERASAALADAGIPGIRYLDEGSRGRQFSNKNALFQEPLTYNYVGTDPSKLDILAKYGVAGAVAGPTLGAYTRQDNYEEAR